MSLRPMISAFGSIDGIEHDEPRIVGKAIGIFEGVMKSRFERQPRRIGNEIDLAGTRQDFAPTDPIVNQKPEPQQRRGAPRLVDRQHKADRPDQVRSSSQ